MKKKKQGKTRKKIIASATMMLLLSLMHMAILITISQPATEWETETIDTSSHTIHWTDLATDNNNHTHIAYEDNETSMTLSYALWNGSSWTTSIIDTNGGRPSISINSSNTPYVAYISEGDLICAWNVSSWVNETVVSGGVSGRPVICHDGGDGVHIVYYDSVNGSIRHVSNSTGSWVMEDVFGSDNGFPGLSIDGDGNPHVLYGMDGVLYHGWNSTGSWVNETVGAAGNSDHGNSLCVNGTGVPHIIYRDGSSNLVTYVRNVSGGLEYEEVDSGEWYGSQLAISLGTDDSPCAVYTTTLMYPRYLKYAERGISGWSSMVVKQNGYWSPGIDVSLNGSVHVCYGMYSTGELGYARGDPVSIGGDTVYVAGGTIIVSDALGTGCLVVEMDDIMDDPDVDGDMVWNQSGGVWMVNLTLAIWENVTLDLGGGNGSGWLKLNTNYTTGSSSIECNGTVSVRDGMVTGWVQDTGPYQPDGTENNTVYGRYRPYIHVFSDTGSLYCDNATIGYLGYGDERGKHGVSVEEASYNINNTSIIHCYTGLCGYHAGNSSMGNSSVYGVDDTGEGIWLRFANDTYIGNTEVHGISMDDGRVMNQGIHIYDSLNVSVSDVTVYGCDGGGICLNNVSLSSIDGYVHNNSVGGVSLEGCDNMSFTGLSCSDNPRNMIIGDLCRDISLSGCLFHGGQHGMCVNGTAVNLTDCVATDASVCGFSLTNSSLCVFSGCNASGCGQGWNFTGSWSNSVSNGSSADCDEGIVFHDTGDIYPRWNNISSMNVSGASTAGVHLTGHSHNNTFINVSVEGCLSGLGFRISGSSAYNSFTGCHVNGSYGHCFMMEDLAGHNSLEGCSGNRSSGFSGFFLDDYSSYNSLEGCHGCNNSASGLVMDRYSYGNLVNNSVFSGNGINGVLVEGDAGYATMGNLSCTGNTGHGIRCDEAAHDTSFPYCDNHGNGENDWYMGNSVDAISLQSDYVLSSGTGVFGPTRPYGSYSPGELDCSSLNMIVHPLAEPGECSVTMDDFSGMSLRRFTVSSTGSTSVYVLIGDLAYNATYTVSIWTGSRWNPLEELVASPGLVRNITPCINFTWSGPWSSHQFKVLQETEGEPWSPPPTGGYPDGGTGGTGGTDDKPGDTAPPSPEPPEEDSPETRIPDVKKPEKPGVFHTFEDAYRYIGVESMGTVTGSVTVVVIDTGVAPVQYDRYGLDLSRVRQESMPIYINGIDDNGHGTWCCSVLQYLAQGSCPGMNLISLKALNSTGEMSTLMFTEAMDMARDLGADIISISAGATGKLGGIVDDTARSLARSGIIVVASAGNNGPYPWGITTPGLSPSVIAVGSINPGEDMLDRSDDVVSSWSSRGPVTGLGEVKPDVVAVGESIIGPWLDEEQTISGTSMAVPFIAGGLAMAYADNSMLISIVKAEWFYWKGIIPWVFEKGLEDSCTGNMVDYNTGEGVPDFSSMSSGIHMYLLFFSIVNPLTIGILAVSVFLAARHRHGKKGKKGGHR